MAESGRRISPRLLFWVQGDKGALVLAAASGVTAGFLQVFRVWTGGRGGGGGGLNDVWLLSATQCIDRCWRSLKQYIPNSLHSKIVDRQLNPKIFDYVLSFEFRRNKGPDLWSALGALAQKAKRTKRVSKNCVRP